MRIQHNIMAMNSYRNYTANNKALSKNLEKLSSGYKINRAGDDAAGLAISEKMRAQITGLKAAQKNAKDGISLVQTAEGALTEVHSMLNRMVDLADQSANGTYDNDTDRANLQKEVDALKSEIDRIADSTNFNGIKLLDGSLGGGGVGAAGIPSISGLDLSNTAATKGSQTIDIAALTAAPAGNEVTATINFTDAAGKNQSVDLKLTFNAADKTLTTAGGKVISLNSSTAISKTEMGKAFQAAIEEDSTLSKVFKASVSTGGQITLNNIDKGANVKVNSVLTNKKADGTAAANGGTLATTSAPSGADAFDSIDFAADYTSGDIFTIGGKKFAFAATQTAAVALGKDVNVIVGTLDSTAVANMADLIEQKTGYKPTVAANSTVMEFKAPTGGTAISGKGLTLQIGDTAEDFNQLTVSIGDMHAKSLGIDGVDISTQEGAKAAVDSIRSAINSVSSTRGNLGALQNRLDHTINNLSVMTENIQDAEANIRDVDVAEEMMAYTKNNILVQSAQAMLAQANQVPQGVLQLLQ